MKGTTVQLVKKTQSGIDALGNPIYTTELIDVDDVLVGTPTSDEVIGTLKLYGKRIAYTLGIPKGDSHVWVDTDVYIWGDKYRTIGYPVTGEQANIPLRWGQNVRVERYG